MYRASKISHWAIRAGSGLALCAACGSTVTKPNPTGMAGGAGQLESAGAGGEGDAPHTGAGAGTGAVGGSDGGAGGASLGGERGFAGSADDAGAAGMAGSSEPACRPVLPVTYRDFNPYGAPAGHDDFEMSARGIKNSDGSTYQGWNDVGCGLVQTLLGADGKPRVFTGVAEAQNGLTLPGIVGLRQRIVTGPGCFTAANPNSTAICSVGSCQPWAITPPTSSIKSGSTFEQWFRTVEGVNIEISSELVLTETGVGSGIWSFDSDAFFPLDGAGFGNSPGLAHNYSFTSEAHVQFTYQTGQRLAFRGDDDVWIFVNRKLALDIGGQHQPLAAELDLAVQAATLGLVPGQRYALDLFHAERQSTSSSFHLATNISCFEPG